jgi:DNA excision repair protein ERCC-2
MREGQRDFHSDCREAAREGMILLANAPTGIGKTAAALSAALEAALPAGRKVVFLTHRKSHHIQAMVEAREIVRKRPLQIASLRPSLPRLRVVDKISKQRMCLLRQRDPSDDSPFLLCEIAHCKYSRPHPSVVESLLSEPKSASESASRSLLENYCAHYAALGAMKEADVIVCDYSYLFEAGILGMFLSHIGMPLFACDAIIDEAHNLPDRIHGMNEREIGEKTTKHALRALADARKRAEEAPAMLARINFVAGYVRGALAPEIRALVEGSNAAGEERRLEKGELAAFLPQRFGQHGLGGSWAAPESALEAAPFLPQRFGQHGLAGTGGTASEAIFSIAEFLRAEAVRQGENARLDVDGLSSLVELSSFLHSAEMAASGNAAYGIFLKASQDRELFRMRACLFDASLVSRQVFAEVHSAVLMSGTLIGKRGLCDLLGIDAARAMGLQEGSYPSPFDPERKRVRICSWVSSRQRERLDGKRVKVMAAIIDEAARACAPHSLAIFYPSYEYLRMVKDELMLKGFRHETETRRDRHMAAEERKGRIEARTFDDKPHVLHAVIGGSYSEGMDFCNNPFKLIVLAGFPYPKPDAVHEAYENYLAGKFGGSRAGELASVLPACIKSAQAMGRGIRKAEDWCYCLLIDDRFVKYAEYLEPTLRGELKAVAGNEKKKIWEDITHFMERMETGKP